MTVWKRFLGSTDGNMALMTGALAIPLVLALGVSIDYSNLAKRASSLQQAVDSAALAIAREGMTITDAKARAIAREFVGANL
ncbi:MAG: pilus assembly protein [Brucellaceae bacterium]|nr:pilus assembly protein [Brucellaceae bacterium]